MNHKAARLGLERHLCIEAPLMWIDKAQTSKTAFELGERHSWGYGCASCPACDLRRRGYEPWAARR